jgi:hypothetical protein
VTDPTSHFNIFWNRRKTTKNARPSSVYESAVNVWYGFRLAPFTGSGFYKGVPATFAFTYFGPSIGVGRLNRVNADATGTMSGWLMTSGVAAQSRLSRVDPSKRDEVDGEFNPRGFAFDAPGLWMEARYLHISYGALGLNGVAGVQFGRKKFFLYGGLGAAFWH